MRGFLAASEGFIRAYRDSMRVFYEGSESFPAPWGVRVSWCCDCGSWGCERGILVSWRLGVAIVTLKQEGMKVQELVSLGTRFQNATSVGLESRGS